MEDTAMREETGSQISARLLEVIAHADFEVLPQLYAFGPLPEGMSPRKDALACVRDGGAWSQLVPVADEATPMAFRIFSFHFDPAFDATGFVGWLHAHLARSTDTGPIVVCGRSPRGAADHVRGGIFDYWGCPAAAADRVIAEVRALIERGRRPRRPHVGAHGGCLLCEAVSGTPRLPLVAESAGAVGVLNVGEPSAPGHCVFFPRRHTPNLHDLDDAELTEIVSLVKRVALALELDQYNVVQNNGARAGQTVSHAHVHLVPKPTAAAGLMVLPGLAAVDQTGLAERIRSRLATPRS
jgi:diadenosine tetraphosphate (Ap4A) HIT family hydrolase